MQQIIRESKTTKDLASLHTAPLAHLHHHASSQSNMGTVTSATQKRLQERQKKALDSTAGRPPSQIQLVGVYKFTRN